ncbi:hypothetical protein AC578_10552 [Pseudocercospora eumusae]|uniref:Uncharacterized protein n=1 Tax=Pseudocercospora eumusae TaxID=321146 RepID=A0A139H629_9PEZI|nr:hypothetical protein AC578_10552 [Pseudocercospora eumusae]
MNPKVDECYTKYANAENVKRSTVDELAMKTDNVSLDWNWGAELDKMITATGSIMASIANPESRRTAISVPGHELRFILEVKGH